MSSASLGVPSAAALTWPLVHAEVRFCVNVAKLDVLAELRVEVVLELRVVAVVDELVELGAAHTRRDVVRAGSAEHGVRVAIDLVRPAHVLREQAARDHVVADHGLGGHVADDRVREGRALALELLHVLHVVAADRVRPRLVEDDDHDPGGRVRRLRGGARRRGHQHRQREQKRDYLATGHGRDPSLTTFLQVRQILSYLIYQPEVNGRLAARDPYQEQLPALALEGEVGGGVGIDELS